ERIEQLRRMWERGMTASQIAEELGGVSRNAVIGKAHRLGLQARPSPVKSAEAARSAAAPQARKAPAPAAKADTGAGAGGEPRAANPQPKPAPPAETRAAPPQPVTAPPVPEAAAPAPQQPRIVSVGPGGFLRQGPGDMQQPI